MYFVKGMQTYKTTSHAAWMGLICCCFTKNPNPCHDAWADSLANNQFSAKAFEFKIDVWDKASTTSPPTSHTYDYSNRHEVNAVLITMHGLHGNIGHYERNAGVRAWLC